MTRKRKLLLALILLSGVLFRGFSVDWLDKEENEWLNEHRHLTLKLGFDPQAGMEYFQLHGREYGFVLNLAEIMSESMGLNVQADRDKNWGEAFSGLQSGEIDILFGANETTERKETMIFTKSLYKIPYSLLAGRNRSIFVVGDLENKKVGFIEGDIIIDLFPKYYSSINYESAIFNDQDEALESLNSGAIDSFITSGGIVIFDYLKKYTAVKEIKILDNFTSDMTLSVRKDNLILAGILDKFIDQYNSELNNKVDKIGFIYNYKVMGLTEEELNWILNEGTAVVGVTKNYLPFDFLEKGEFRGINASILREVSKLTDIRFIPVLDDFDALFDKALMGEVNILNLAKTKERMNQFYYTQPFSQERDEIYGHKNIRYIDDIYGLNNTTVAVVKGYWHKELLEKNAINATIYPTESLKESMKAVLDGKADYLIENPSVIKYYIQEWEFFDLMEKGMTSYNSFLYFGISKNKPELASIMDKAMDMIDLEKAFGTGFNEIPQSSSKKTIFFQLGLIVLLIISLISLAFIAYKQAKDLLESRMTAERLQEREELMYRDPMTDLYNRHYLYHKVEPFIRKWKYPQTIIMCDLNNLKTANDKWGHAIGDKLLNTFGVVLKENFDPEDILIRMGGDEFLIIITGKTDSEAQKSAQNMEKILTEYPIKLSDGTEITPSTAWGMATRFHNSHITFEDLQIEADNNMYDHKKKMKDSL